MRICNITANIRIQVKIIRVLGNARAYSTTMICRWARVWRRKRGKGFPVLSGRGKRPAKG